MSLFNDFELRLSFYFSFTFLFFQSNSMASRMTTFLFFLQIEGNSRILSGQVPRPTSRVMHGISLSYKGNIPWNILLLS